MKKLYVVAATILATVMLLACHTHAKNSAAADTDTTADAVADTSIKSDPVIDKDDSTFAVNAANCGLAEIALGKLAMQMGRSKEVKNYGAMMIKAHAKADTRLLVLAKAKNITLPLEPDAGAEKTLHALSKEAGNGFDKAYIDSMIADHEQAVTLFENASKKCQDPDLKQFAIKTLPVLQTHLDAINAIHDSMSQ
jgi:putative membrane protein